MALENFVKVIATPEGDLNFYFNKIFTAHGIRYHVSAVSKLDGMITFRMMKENNRWYIDNPKGCPEWIINLEPKISDIIIESLTA